MGRQTLAGRWTEAFKVMMVVYAITMLPSVIIPMISHDAFTISALNVYTAIVSGPITLGVSVYFLKVFRQQEGGIQDVLYAFNYMWKSFILLLLILVKTLLWSLLFVIPGIIAAFSYSQAFFILADDPGKSPSLCIQESKAMMAGNKGRLFCLELSFIGWSILAMIPAGIGSMIFQPEFSRMQYYGDDWESIFQASAQMAYEPIHPAVYLFSIGTVFVGIYITVAQACFYELANGNLQVSRPGEIPAETKVQSDEPEEIKG